MTRRLLLVSSSRSYGSGYLEHCREAVRSHFAGSQAIVFIPFALADRDGYAAIAKRGLEPLGISVASLHRAADMRASLEDAAGVFVGGGNTFRLLKTLYEYDLLDTLRARVEAGMPYMGASAGSNLACPTIRTTNDMPIVQPPSFAALDLIPFQLNPHFIDADPNSTHQGETREVRLGEYLEENETPVLGLREGSWLAVVENTAELQGATGGVWFTRGAPPRELPRGMRWDLSAGPPWTPHGHPAT